MHDTALAIGSKFLDLYAKGSAPKIIVEIGSLDVNGSLRASSPPNSTYIGLDVVNGPGVDIVVRQREPFPIRSECADIVLTTSQMEHDECFWNTFLELARIIKPGGYIYFSAPSNGFYHTFPQDLWRFYPDSGKALAEWARSSGHDLMLIESFVADRDRDVWNDFVAVFRKQIEGPSVENEVLLSQIFPCSNVWTYDAAIIQKRSDLSEDLRIIERLQELLRKEELAKREALELAACLAARIEVLEVASHAASAAPS